MSQKITLGFFAQLREQRGLSEEEVTTEKDNYRDLYQELSQQYGFSLELNQVKLAIDEEYCDWDRQIQNGDHAVFIPPVSGG